MAPQGRHGSAVPADELAHAVGRAGRARLHRLVDKVPAQVLGQFEGEP